MTRLARRARRTNVGLAEWVSALRSAKATMRLTELARLTGLSEPAARQAAYRLGQRGWLARVGKGFYANTLRSEGPPTSEQVAPLLYPPAYISLASALFAHGIVDQAPYLLTCVTTNKTRRFATGLGEIAYQQLKPALFFGYSLDAGVALARPEKAVLDFVYLELQNGKEPALDDWNWHELDLAVLRTWTTVFPRTVSDVLARYAPPGPTDWSGRNTHSP